MSIGETLAQARRGSGLTLAEVSQRTRIRETLVRDIERDDYSGCGGDFYTRGHIRAIARVVGADPGPLIEEYDAARRPPTAENAPDNPQFSLVRPRGFQRQEPSAEPPTDPFEPIPPAPAPGWQQPRQPRQPEPPAGPPARAPQRPEPPAGPPAAAPQRPEPAAGPQAGVPQGPEPPAGAPRRVMQIGAADRPEPPAGPPGGAPQRVTQIGAADRPEPPAEPPARVPYQYGPGAYGPAPGGRRQRNWPVLFGLVVLVVLGFLGYYFVSGSGRAPSGTPAAGSQGASAAPGRSAGASGGAGHSAHMVVVHLTAIRASSVEFTTPGGKTLFSTTIAAGSSKKWTFRQPVTMRLGNPGGVKLSVDGKNPLPRGSAARQVTLSLSPGHPAIVATPAGTPTPASTRSPAVPLSTSVPLIPVSAAAFGATGAGQGDDPQLAHLAIDRSRATAWTTDWYTSAHFGNLYSGTGLLIDMGRPVTITSAQIWLGSAPGASFQLRVGSTPALTGLPTVARAFGASGVVHLQLSRPAHGRYVLIWFTKLPLDSNGNFQASVYNVRLEGRV